MEEPLKVGNNLFDNFKDFEDCDLYEVIHDYFLVKDNDGNKHKAKLIKSDKVGVLWELFIYDEIVR